ncbi:MAG: aminotransferase class I/II-fold pyridoxal phosphate-dependent enzyme [Candidatus Hodarchaeales archaeon]|jgi:aspartate aminotransferase
MPSSQINDLEGSATAEFFSLAKKREAEGHDIIHLEIGQPDFQPLKSIINETIDAIQEGKTTYTLSSGIPELRESISQVYYKDYEIEIDPQKEIRITSGAKLGILATFYSVMNRGEALIVPEPAWVSYRDMATLAGAKYIPIPMKDDFSLNQEVILSCMSKDPVTAIIVNSPNNPSGHILSVNEINFLKDLVEDHNINIISDEIYNEYSYINHSTNTLLTELLNWQDNLIVINGFAKTYSMTGYRLGWTISEASIANGVLKFIQASTSCPTNFCQWAGVKALKDRQEARRIIKEVFPERRKIVLNEIKNTPGITVGSIDGAFYAFIKYSFTNKPSEEVAKDILLNANVCVIPGTAFGYSAEGYLRITFSRSIEEIKEAFNRIRRYVDQIT